MSYNTYAPQKTNLIYFVGTYVIHHVQGCGKGYWIQLPCEVKRSLKFHQIHIACGSAQGLTENKLGKLRDSTTTQAIHIQFILLALCLLSFIIGTALWMNKRKRFPFVSLGWTLSHIWLDIKSLHCGLKWSHVVCGTSSG